MRILELRSSNFKKIKAIDITPKENVVVISGKNEQGKSSVLDSIWATLKNKAVPQKPIRNGEEKAENELKLGEDGIVKYIVKRTFTEKGDYLTVMNAEGARFPSPQKMLDDFVGNLSFDPLEFIRKENSQKELLLKIVKFEMVPADLDEIGYTGEVPNEPLYFLKTVKNEYYQERTIINRNLLNLEEQLKSIPEVQAATEVSVRDLFEKKQELQRTKDVIVTEEAKNKSKNLEITQQGEQIDRESIELTNYIKRKEEEIEEYVKAQKRALKEYVDDKKGEITKLKECQETLSKDLEANQGKFNEMLAEVPELDKQIQEVDKRIKESDEVNKRAGLYEKREKLKAEQAKVKAASDLLTARLKKIDGIKTRVITHAKMPIEGLSFDGEIITYRDIPISQTSDSEKLKISLAIAMALNPKLRIIRISDGSLLDTENMKVLKEIAKTQDFQIWIERVDETGKMGFYIEEGEIVNKSGGITP